MVNSAHKIYKYIIQLTIFLVQIWYKNSAQICYQIFQKCAHNTKIPNNSTKIPSYTTNSAQKAP